MLILEGHKHAVLAVAYAPDSLTLASGGVDRSVRIWDLANGRARLALPDAGGTVLSLAFSPDNKQLAVGTQSQVTFWDLETRRPGISLHGERGGTYIVAFSPDGSRVVLAGYLDPHLSLYRLADVSHRVALEG